MELQELDLPVEIIFERGNQFVFVLFEKISRWIKRIILNLKNKKAADDIFSRIVGVLNLKFVKQKKRLHPYMYVKAVTNTAAKNHLSATRLK